MKKTSEKANASSLEVKQTNQEVKKTLHEGKKPFQCRMCDNSYSTKGNLTRHVEKNHEINKSGQKSSEVKPKLIKTKTQDNHEIIHQEMDYLRPPSKRVKNAPARFKSDEEDLEKVKERNEQKEETNNSKTINRKRKLNLDSEVKGEIL